MAGGCKMDKDEKPEKGELIFYRTQHIQNSYEQGELGRESTHKKFLSVRREGNRNVRRELVFYNLDMIISVEHALGGARAYGGGIDLSTCRCRRSEYRHYKLSRE